MSLARKAAGSAAWVAGTTYLNQVITFLANIALMRLIAPEAFGALALAVFFCTLMRKLLAFGYNHALIHKQDDLPTAAGTHLLLHVASGMIVLVAMVIVYPLVAAHYSPLVAAVLIGVAVGAALESAGNTPRILLEKDIDFRRLQLLNLGVSVFINALAILAALIWANVWVLMVRLAGAQAISAIGYWWLNPRFPAARPRWAMIRWFMRFGAPLWVGGLATFAVLQFDDFLVGTLISEKELGFYARAYALAVLPTTMVTHIVARVAFPLYSKLQHDKEKLSEAFGLVMRLIVLLSAPAAIGLAYCAPEFVGVVFGDTWRPMVILVQLLLVYELMRPIFDDVGELFTAVGQPRKIGRIQVVQALAMLLVAPPLVYFFQAKGAALTAGAVMLLGVVLAYRDVRAHVTIDFSRIFVAPAVIFALAAALSALVLHLRPVEAEAVRLAAKIGLFGGWSLLLLALIQGRRLREEYRQLRQRLQA